MKKPKGKKLMRTEKHDDVDLTIRAGVTDNSLYIRMAGARAELPDGTTVEIDINMDSSLLVTIKRPGKDGWRTYALTPRAITDAVLKQEELNAVPRQQRKRPLSRTSPQDKR